MDPTELALTADLTPIITSRVVNRRRNLPWPFSGATAPAIAALVALFTVEEYAWIMVPAPMDLSACQGRVAMDRLAIARGLTPHPTDSPYRRYDDADVSTAELAEAIIYLARGPFRIAAEMTVSMVEETEISFSIVLALSVGWLIRARYVPARRARRF